MEFLDVGSLCSQRCCLLGSSEISPTIRWRETKNGSCFEEEMHWEEGHWHQKNIFGDYHTHQHYTGDDCFVIELSLCKFYNPITTPHHTKAVYFETIQCLTSFVCFIMKLCHLECCIKNANLSASDGMGWGNRDCNKEKLVDISALDFLKIYILGNV